MNLPKFTAPKKFNTPSKLIAVADLREEITTISLFKNDTDEQIAVKNYKTNDFGCFSEILNDFKKENSSDNDFAVIIAVPGPVINGKSAPQRLPWTLDEEQLKSKCNLTSVMLLNDLEAYAYGLPSISAGELQTVFQSDNASGGNLAILAAGSGLGEAGVFFDGILMHPFATEGGHCEFSPRTETEVEFYQFLNKIYGIVSWESVLSKRGVFNIYRFLRDVKRHPSVPELDATDNLDIFIEKLSQMQDSLICKITVDTYVEFLAREANSLVLKLKATGGLFIGGEVPAHFSKFITKEKFYDKFLMSDKMDALLQGTSVFMITNNNMVQKGALQFAKILSA